jgi:phosphoribosylaminoimidazolecarboxamide formyltransferase/IMP cyclohydrolase
MKALIAVYNKDNLDFFARSLYELGWEILATGGTFKKIKSAGIPVTSVADFTNQDELLEGRVKTLHPKIYAGILYRRNNSSDIAEMQKVNFEAIDLVACNLYPFFETVTDNNNILIEQAVEQIDIGGPTMLRASAKNFNDVLSVSNPNSYQEVVQYLKKFNNNIRDIPLNFKQKLAEDTFLHTAKYDALIAEYFADGLNVFPNEKVFSISKIKELRYGENPHQEGALYKLNSVDSNTRANTGPIQHHGKDMSYVNVLDADAAYKLVCDLNEPALAIIKHTNPCCFASSDKSLSLLYDDALDNGDALSAFGGIVAVNRRIDKDFADALRKKVSPINGNKMFFEIIISPGIDDDALEHLKKKSKDLRIVTMNPYFFENNLNDYVTVHGGFLTQTVDHSAVKFEHITGKNISVIEENDINIAWKVVKHIKSNAIAIVKNGILLGMGAGQPNRVESTKLAINAAGGRAVGAVLASDAFFPFPDSIEVAGQAGIDIIIQPGGSIRDNDTITTVKKFKMTLFHTGIRHFRH